MFLGGGCWGGGGGTCACINVCFVLFRDSLVIHKLIRGLVVHPTYSLNLLTTSLKNDMLYLPGGINEPMYFYKTSICCGFENVGFERYTL